MAYNNGRENRKWLIWKEAEEKILREHGVDENTIEQIRTDDRADFNSNRRFYHWTSNFGEYLEGMADSEQNTELKTVADLLDEIEDETLYNVVNLSRHYPIIPTGNNSKNLIKHLTSTPKNVVAQLIINFDCEAEK